MGLLLIVAVTTTIRVLNREYGIRCTIMHAYKCVVESEWNQTDALPSLVFHTWLHSTAEESRGSWIKPIWACQ
jgi:hypothetical protein